MRLIIIAEENVYEHEVDPSHPRALYWLNYQTGLPSASIRLNTDSGDALSTPSKTLESHGLKGESSTIFMSTM